jgi:hypothetical protein
METITSSFANKDLYNSKIFINKNSLSTNLCSEIINKFESSGNTYKGVVKIGLDLSIKNTRDMVISAKDKEWSEISKTLDRELKFNIAQYLKSLNDVEDFKSEHNNSDYADYMTFKSEALSREFFMVQKYTKNTGRYIYHDDFKMDFDSKMARVITYLWYLNDVEVGGETVFQGKYKIKPETGKLILFPASWTYPHCGKMPISDNKYIITGWIYSAI